MKKLVAASYNFSQKVGIPCSLILSITNREDDEGGAGEVKRFLLKDQKQLKSDSHLPIFFLFSSMITLQK